MAYSLTVVRPTRIGRVSPPSDTELARAMAAESALTQGMTQPGANQMIGHRFLAQQRAMDAQQNYTRASEEHSDTLAAMREEDRARFLADQATRNRQALLTAGINNPAGMAALEAPEVTGLLSPETRSMYRDYLAAGIDQRRRTGGGGSGGRDPTVMSAGETARLDAGNERSILQAVTAENNRLQREIAAINSNATREIANTFRESDRARIRQTAADLVARAEAASRTTIEGLRNRSRMQTPPQAPAAPNNAPETTQPAPRDEAAPPPNAAAPPAATLPQAARQHLREGVVTQFQNGQKWTLRGGQPVRVE
jgi:hypothetical protein